MLIPGKLFTFTEVEKILMRITCLPHKSPWTTATIATMTAAGIGFLGVYLPDPANKGGCWLGISLSAALVLFCIAWNEQLFLKKYTDRLARDLAGSNLIERLAMGWEQLVEIYDYTPFPWRLHLGPRPRTLSRSVLLLVGNLDWYLREPRKYINPLIVLGVVSIGILLAVVVGLMLEMSGFRLGLSSGIQDVWIMYLLVALLFPLSWSVSHYFLRLKIAASVILAELKRRVND